MNEYDIMSTLRAAINKARRGAAGQRESIGLGDGVEASEIRNDRPRVNDGDAESGPGG